MTGFTLPQINPALYVFIFAQTFLFVPVVAALAVARFASASGPARAMGFAAAGLALGALALQFGPAFLGLRDGAFPVLAGQAVRALDGMALPLAPALALLVSGALPGRRLWGIDALHALALAGFVGLYAYTRLV